MDQNLDLYLEKLYTVLVHRVYSKNRFVLEIMTVLVKLLISV